MGTIASTHPSHGASVNPRLTYAQQRAKKGNKSILIDTPSLIKLSHGTLRYRYIDDGTSVDDRRVELPHEGDTHGRKHGYFYHSHLNDFSTNGREDKEMAWKFKYVSRGANREEQRKVFYVCGQGVPRVRPHTSQQQQPSEGHVYYALTSIQQGVEHPQHIQRSIITDDDAAADDTATKPPPNLLQLKAVSSESILEVRRRVAVHLLLPPPFLHITFRGQPLGTECLLTELLPDNSWKAVDLTLTLKGTTSL